MKCGLNTNDRSLATRHFFAASMADMASAAQA